MKKLVSVFLIACMAVGLVACGGKEQSATYTMEQDANGVVIKDTMTLNAKGDKVQQIVETMEVDMSSLDDADAEAMVPMYEAIVESYQTVEGVTASGALTDKVYKIDVTIDTTGDAVSQLSELGLMAIEGNAKGFSLIACGSAMVASGYTKVE